ncbi:MAG TPA: hypothetical protein VMS76_19550, partial [Planctomycetota bacterium]|nr:hypothetical protein [Planctomycetota bacterium]
MIDHTSPGAKPLPGTGAGDGPAHGLSSESTSRAGDGSLEIDSTGGEPAGGSAPAGTGTRRRRRGGARRRRRTSPAGGAPESDEAREDGEPAGAVALEERSPQPFGPSSGLPPGEEPRRKRSRRRRRRSRPGEPAAPAADG